MESDDYQTPYQSVVGTFSGAPYIVLGHCLSQIEEEWTGRARGAPDTENSILLVFTINEEIREFRINGQTIISIALEEEALGDLSRFDKEESHLLWSLLTKAKETDEESFTSMF